jgi:hypothetical protein
MTVGIKPYLGTGLAEMLAERGIEARQSRLRQQEAMAPALMQALAPAIQQATFGEGEYLQNAMQALNQTGFGNFGIGGGLQGMLSGQQPAAQQAPGRQPAQTLYSPEERRQIARMGLSNFQQRLAQEQALVPAQQKAMGENVANWLNQSQSAGSDAQRTLAIANELERSLEGLQIGPTSAVGIAGGIPLIGDIVKSNYPEVNEALAQADLLYQQVRNSDSGRRLFSKELPQNLQINAKMAPAQIKAVLDAIKLSAQLDVLMQQAAVAAAEIAAEQGRPISAEDQKLAIEAAMMQLDAMTNNARQDVAKRLRGAGQTASPAKE